MLIWLITVGEPLPIDEGNQRLLRTGVFANHLVGNDHKVVWWTSDFNHVRKEHRSGINSAVQVNQNLTIRLLHSTGYSRNISPQRVIDHLGIAKQFASLSAHELLPDIIVCSLPTLALSREAVRYGNRNHVPVIIDIRDLWPDVFLDIAPAKTVLWLRKALDWLYRWVGRTLSDARGIVGITDEFVAWGLALAGRNKSEYDRVFPLGYNTAVPKPEDVETAYEFWAKHGIRPNSKDKIICFFGTLGHQFDLDTVIEAAKLLKIEAPNVRFVLCGTGDSFAHYQSIAADCRNVLLPGWVGSAEIWTLMRMSAVGLAPYVDTKNFRLNLPNKPIEYLSGGLPVVYSLPGVMDRLMTENQCGVRYHNGDAEELAGVLASLLQDDMRLLDMQQHAYDLYINKYVAEKVYNEYSAYLQEVVRFSKDRH